MMRPLIVAAGAAAMLAVSPAQAEMNTMGRAAPQTPPPYTSTASTSVELVSSVPCDRVRHNADGSWTMLGTVVMSGITMTNTSFKGGREGPILASRCGHANGK